ncbi:hypothetical protein APR04_004401 [Promicromonospora umidemergens]|uniref:Uncharacterized protein n=1 Tax=Promicromonospora umidemergens TaxID=629679 RepID=A0ABP8WXF8_9MICO|nr:hypothetical protein [Promicromonospora umidemergens]MCP2285466.1 hypothetical protein [Promicromonospora umidemergens]
MGGDWVKNPVDPLDQTGYDAIPFNDDGDTCRTPASQTYLPR